MDMRRDGTVGHSLCAPGLYRFAVGDFALAVIGDGDRPGSDGTSVLFLDTGRTRLLIDAGFGGATEDGPGWIEKGLAGVGASPADIDTVVISHAHQEHVAGLVDDRGGPVFPNARYVIDRREWGAWSSGSTGAAVGLTAWPDGERADAARAVVARRVSFIRPGRQIVAGVSAIDACGHTPGHLAFVVASRDEVLVHTADVLCGDHGQLLRTESDAAADSDGLLGAVTRLAMLARLASDRCLTFAPRAPFPGLGTVDFNEGVFRWLPVGPGPTSC